MYLEVCNIFSFSNCHKNLVYTITCCASECALVKKAPGFKTIFSLLFQLQINRTPLFIQFLSNIIILIYICHFVHVINFFFSEILYLGLGHILDGYKHFVNISKLILNVQYLKRKSPLEFLCCTILQCKWKLQILKKKTLLTSNKLNSVTYYMILIIRNHYNLCSFALIVLVILVSSQIYHKHFVDSVYCTLEVYIMYFKGKSPSVFQFRTLRDCMHERIKKLFQLQRNNLLIFFPVFNQFFFSCNFFIYFF